MITLTSYSSVYRVEWTDSKQHATQQRRVTAKDPAISFYFRREFLLPPRVFNFRRELFFFAVSFSLLLWAFLFCRELFSFVVSFSLLPWAFLFCRELFYFAVSFSLLPWAFPFLPWAFLFCRELFSFAVSFSLLPWHLWATVRIGIFPRLKGKRLKNVPVCSSLCHWSRQLHSLRQKVAD